LKKMPDKKRERFYLEALQRAMRDAPSGLPEEPEPPDFVFVTDRHRLGIELTTFYLPPNPGERPHQEWQSLKDQIVSEAERIHASEGGLALYVSVLFTGHERIRKKDIQIFARELADAVLNCPAPRHISEPMLEIPWGRRPKWAAAIQVHGSIDDVDKLWHADAGGWVAEITSEHVSEIVKAKARREPLARTQCDELWLVIVNDNFSKAAQAEISAEALSATYDGPFDRLVWLLPQVPRAIELRLSQPAA
jgi:hypothetical protein